MKSENRVRLRKAATTERGFSDEGGTGLLQTEQGIHCLAKDLPLRALPTPDAATARGQPVIVALAVSSHSLPATGDEALAFQMMQHVIYRAEMPADGVLGLLGDTAHDLVP